MMSRSLALKLDDDLAEKLRLYVRIQLRLARKTHLIGPEDVARAAAHDLRCNWNDLMRPVRVIVAQMALAGELEVYQDGHQVDILDARGPVYLRKRKRGLR